MDTSLPRLLRPLYLTYGFFQLLDNNFIVGRLLLHKKWYVNFHIEKLHVILPHVKEDTSKNQAIYVPVLKLTETSR